MGTSSVAMDRIYAGLIKSRLEAGTEKAQLWASEAAACLAGGAAAWRRVGLRQMSGILVVAFVRWGALESAVVCLGLVGGLVTGWSTPLTSPLLALINPNHQVLDNQSNLHPRPLPPPPIRAELEHHVGELATTSVTCGVMGVGGNKGAVALSFSLMRRRIMVVGSHFAAHQVGGRVGGVLVCLVFES